MKKQAEIDERKEFGAFERKLSSLFGTETRKEVYVVLMSVFFGVMLLIISNLILSGLPLPYISILMTIMSIFIIVVPMIFYQYRHYKKMKNIEENFPNFIKSISEGLNSNMSLPQAVMYASRSDFGALSPYIDRMVSHLSWGIDFEKVLKNMAHSIDNKLITRSISTIIEAHNYGGNISRAMAEIGKSVTEIEKLRRERLSSISGQMMQGYIIFFVFVGVMIGLVVFLIPVLGTESLGVGTGNANLALEYGRKFRHLSIIQGFFSGLAIGKLAEGSISAGMKHAFIMAMIGYVALSIATV